MNLINDLSYSIRLLRKTPAFTLVCLLVVTLGVGVAVSLYALNKNFYFGELPFPNGDRFVVLNKVDAQTNGDQGASLDVNGFTFNRLRDLSSSFSELGAFRSIGATISDGESAEFYAAAEIMPNLLAATAVQPMLGRTFISSDAEAGAEPVVLISYRLWQNYYAQDPGIVGRVARINGNSFAVVGVMPEKFSFPTTHQVWFPLSIPASSPAQSSENFGVVGILAENIGREQASLELANTLSQIRSEYPNLFVDLYGNVTRYTRIWAGDSGGIPLILGVLALTIILLVSLNLSTLLFVRTNARHQELAVRNALGANRWQNFRQVLTESLVICLIGSVLGFALAEFINRIYQASVTALASGGNSVMPFWIDFTPDNTAVMITAGLMIIIWLFSGGLAAKRASASELSQVLEGSKGATNRFGTATMRIVVGVEIMFSVFLLILCALFILTMRDAANVDYGTNSEGVYVADINLSDRRYDQFEARRQFFNNLNNELLNSSEIQSVTATTALPGWNGVQIAFELGEGEVADANDPLQVETIWVSDNYFASLGILPLSGREFDVTDIGSSSSVAVVDEEFASTYWPDESALGKLVRLDRGESDDWLTVIGITPAIKQGSGVGSDNPPVVYLPFDEHSPRSVSIVLKTTGNTDYPTITEKLKTAALVVDRDIAITEISSLAYTQSLNTVAFTFFGNFLIGVGLTTLFLSVVGIYGVISRSIVLRTNEIGIRRALGSSSRKIISVFIKQGLRFFSIGAIIGGAAVLLIVNSVPTGLSNALFDYLYFSIASCFALVACLVIAASYIPARAAVALEPGDALHYD